MVQEGSHSILLLCLEGNGNTLSNICGQTSFLSKHKQNLNEPFFQIDCINFIDYSFIYKNCPGLKNELRKIPIRMICFVINYSKKYSDIINSIEQLIDNFRWDL